VLQRAADEPQFFALRVTEITPADTHMVGRFSHRMPIPHRAFASFTLACGSEIASIVCRNDPVAKKDPIFNFAATLRIG
jgi:hypothetical protein